MVTSPGTLLFHTIPGVLLLFAIMCLVLGIREKKWYNMGITFLVAAGIIGYAIPSILKSMGIHITTTIPTVNYTSTTFVEFTTVMPSSWIVTNPGHTVHLAFAGCGHGTVTIIGPGIYETVSIPDTISLRFNSTGTYYISYFCEVGKSTKIVKVAYAVVEVRKISINWLVEALIDSLNMIIQSIFSTICNIFGRLLQFFGLDYLYLTPSFNFVHTYKTVLTACISISLILLAIDAAIIAFESKDPLDFLLNFCYDFGLWAFGTFYGYVIYNIAASFLNYIVITCLNYSIIIVGTLQFTGIILGIFFAILFVSIAIPTESFPILRLLVLIPLLSFFLIGLMRIILIQALLTIFPLIMALWVLPYTRRIANTLIMMMAWATLGGVVNAAVMYVFLHFMYNVQSWITHGGLVLLLAVAPILQLLLFISLISIRREFGAQIRKRL